MIKGLGRIMAVGVGAFMLVIGILFMTKITYNIDNIASIIYGIVLILAGLSAGFAGVKGEGGFWFTIFSLVMIGLVIWYGIANKDKFSPFTWDYLGKFLLSLILQILYALSFIFILIGKSKK